MTRPRSVSTDTLPASAIRRLMAHQVAGRFEALHDDALALLRLRPDSAIAWNMLGVAAHRLGNLRLALHAKRRAARLLPRDVAIQTNLANTLRQSGRLSEAVRILSYAASLPDAPAATHNLLAIVLQALGRIDEARAAFAAAMERDPSFVQAHSNLLFLLTHESDLDPDELLDAHRDFDRRHGMPLHTFWQPHANSRDPDRRLRVGFVSGDLRRHPVALFIAPIWQELQDSHLDIVAYANHSDEDEVTQKLKTLCQAWVPVWGLDDEAMTRRIRADRIDILVDLSGHTAHHRLLVFARKPAPVQVSAIGYPNTTGMVSIDYTISDQYRTPARLAAQLVEKVAWIPSACTFARGDAPDPSPLPALQAGHLTFGSFQRSIKIGPRSLDLWSHVLRALPDARLLIGGVKDPATRQRLSSGLEQRGVEPHRIDLLPPLPMAEYLRAHARIDLLLDTVPYPSGTTAHHGLWMGVPTLTCTGATPATWQCAGLLGAAGLDDFVVHDEAAFVQRAIDWSRRLDELAARRQGLPGHLSRAPLLQPRTVAAGVDAALREMWRRWCRDEPARSFEIGRG